METPGAPIVAIPHEHSADALVALDYSRGSTDAIVLDSIRTALLPLLLVAILSGLCVGSCFLTMTNDPIWIVLHMLIYAATLGLAVLAGVRMAKSGIAGGRRAAMDTIAGVSLIVVALAPAGDRWGRELGLNDTFGGIVLGTAFLLMSLTSYRHLLLYRLLAGPCRDAGYPRTAKWMTFLGWTKVLYETIWLLCCAVPLLLIGNPLGNNSHGLDDSAFYLLLAAFFGCFGYAAIWMLMIILHARALLLSSRRAPPERSTTV